MDTTTQEIIKQLQKQLMDITIKLHAVCTNLNKLASEDEEESYRQFLAMQKNNKSSIKADAIVCLECGRVCRMLTRRHLATHNLNPDTYRLKWGIRPNAPLMCNDLIQSRKKKMHDLRLWERSRQARKKTD